MGDIMNIPNHVGLIMDGNGRWATKRGLDRSEGHKAGCDAFENISCYIFDKGVKYLSVYAFSTDNFKRPEKEVNFLMNLFVKVFSKKIKKILDRDVRIVFSGRKENLRSDVIKSIEKMEEKTKDNKSGTLNVCLNYGSQEEIVDGIKRLFKDIDEKKFSINDLDKESFYKYMYKDLPPIDLMIRTSGEQRLSNFMLYQLTYSELYFTDTLFPDFDEKEFDKALDAYNNRDRRFGKVNTGIEKK